MHIKNKNKQICLSLATNYNLINIAFHVNNINLYNTNNIYLFYQT
jgi:hypothetical protein